MAGNKNSGRTPGALDKRSATVAELFNDLGYNPLRELQKLSQSTEDDHVRAKCHSECAKYRFPQLKSVEISGTLEHDLRGKPLDELVGMLKDLVSKIGPTA